MKIEFLPFEAAHEDEAWKVFRSRLGTYFAPSEEAEFAEMLTSLRDPDDSPEHVEYWGGWVEGRMVAIGGIEAIDAYGYLCWGTVHAEFAGNGLGRRLLEHRLTILRGLGARSVFSDTTPLVEGFYQRFGFAPYHRRERHWGGELDLVAMELSLDGVHRGASRVLPDGSLAYRPVSS